MSNDYIAALLFFLPAAVSNGTPVLLNRLPYIKNWNTPLDFGKSWHGKRILGDNKRLRGIVFGTIMAGFTAVIISKLNLNTVVNIEPFWIGCMLGFGALLGDAVESFFKRIRGIKPGESWFPFDQTDYILGALALVLPFVALPLWAILTIFIFYFVLHVIVTYLFFHLGFRDRPI